jgi:hypothetical protein
MASISSTLCVEGGLYLTFSLESESLAYQGDRSYSVATWRQRRSLNCLSSSMGTLPGRARSVSREIRYLQPRSNRPATIFGVTTS